MVRFSVNHATYDQHPRDRFPKELGLCVSGQTVQGLLLQLKKYDSLLPNVICLIGTNNILGLVRAQKWHRNMLFSMRGRLMNLKKHLQQRCNKVIFICMPPIPAHPTSKGYVESINKFILGFATGMRDAISQPPSGNQF